MPNVIQSFFFSIICVLARMIHVIRSEAQAKPEQVRGRSKPDEVEAGVCKPQQNVRESSGLGPSHSTLKPQSRLFYAANSGFSSCCIGDDRAHLSKGSRVMIVLHRTRYRPTTLLRPATLYTTEIGVLLAYKAVKELGRALFQRVSFLRELNRRFEKACGERFSCESS